MNTIKILIDGVFFQLNNTGIARLWKSILEILATRNDIEIYFLDRGNAPDIENINYIPFPTYFYHSLNAPADSHLIQKVCDEFTIDVFSSTYYTTPLSTPMILFVYDMIPEVFNFDLSHPMWMEKATAINYAVYYICISKNTRNDLLKYYPEIPFERTAVVYCGIDRNIFKKRENEEIIYFRNKYDLHKPYYLLVGTRVSEKGYKNGMIFFRALSKLPYHDFDILCVGGEQEIEESILSIIPGNVRCIRLDLDDYELSLAYNGAIALVYPSLYEGFGLPVVEAMACGCPVITTKRSSLPEAAGDAAFFIEGTDIEEMAFALQQIRNEGIRSMLVNKGIEHAKKFNWESMAKVFYDVCKFVKKETEEGKFDNFFKKWKALRKIQMDVDYARP